MTIYLAKYRPLNSTLEGQRAATRFDILPYVDGSCRREPDFECEFPSISALCRGKLFAPHLKEGDEVVYITTKNRYGEAFRHWRMVASLKVFKHFDSHSEAAEWYRGKVGKLPSNCIVAGNPPLPLSRTSRGTSNCAPGCGSAAATLKQWNDHYQGRANTIRVFLACKTVWKELTSPAILTDQAALKILKSEKRVNARNPIEITDAELKALESLRLTRNNPKKISGIEQNSCSARREA
jgi:hypothetical protein